MSYPFQNTSSGSSRRIPPLIFRARRAAWMWSSRDLRIAALTIVLRVPFERAGTGATSAVTRLAGSIRVAVIPSSEPARGWPLVPLSFLLALLGLAFAGVCTPCGDGENLRRRACPATQILERVCLAPGHVIPQHARPTTSGDVLGTPVGLVLPLLEYHGVLSPLSERSVCTCSVFLATPFFPRVSSSSQELESNNTFLQFSIPSAEYFGGYIRGHLAKDQSLREAISVLATLALGAVAQLHTGRLYTVGGEKRYRFRFSVGTLVQTMPIAGICFPCEGENVALSTEAYVALGAPEETTIDITYVL
ncbi:hypothetical protein B0H19DRAFT_1373841 [Mycena capillaripes]|nr:hypothetical protein B0H19DRAFT_1373841 [Mycena capillaripes]